MATILGSIVCAMMLGNQRRCTRPASRTRRAEQRHQVVPPERDRSEVLEMMSNGVCGSGWRPPPIVRRFRHLTPEIVERKAVVPRHDSGIAGPRDLPAGRA